MKYKTNDIISNSIRNNIRIYFIVTLFFAIGIAIGAFTVKSLDYNQKQELVSYLNRFFQIMDKEGVKGINIFLQSIKNNFQTVFFIWLLSITVIGVPVTLFIMSFRGFIVGFTIAFFIQGMAWKGLLLTSLAVLPQNIIYIPCLLAISGISLSFSLQLFRRKMKKGVSNQYKGNILSYTITIALIFVLMCCGSLIEAYLSPILLRSISAYMIIQ